MGSIVTLIKFVMYMHGASSELNFEKYVLVRCFDEKNNVYFNLLYYLSNYLLGVGYLKMFRDLYSKFKTRLMEGLTLLVAAEEFVCAVCMGEVRVGYRVIRLVCGHEFHQSCLRKWVMHRNVCPVCKHKVAGILEPEATLEI